MSIIPHLKKNRKFLVPVWFQHPSKRRHGGQGAFLSPDVAVRATQDALHCFLEHHPNEQHTKHGVDGCTFPH